MATLEYITSQCVTKLRLQAGLLVNTYTEDRIAAEVNLQFKKLFRLRFWDDYTSTVTYALDTTTGLISGSMASQCKRFTDIQHVWMDDVPTPLKRAPENANINTLKKPSIIPHMTDTTKLFKVLNPENITNVHVKARLLPDDFTTDDEILLDETLLIYSTLYTYTTETGLNPAAAEMFKMFYDEHLATVMGDQNFSVIDGDPWTENTQTEWYGV